MPETEQYDRICKDRFDELKQGQDALHAGQNEILNRLFKDNGCKSVQTVLNDLGRWQETHDKTETKSATFWYWLVPLFVSIGIVIIDKIWR